MGTVIESQRVSRSDAQIYLVEYMFDGGLQNVDSIDW